MLQHNILKLALVQRADHLVPEHTRLHDVALFHGSELVATLARELEPHARDALDLIGVVDLGIDGALLPIAEVVNRLRLAEIDAAGELAQDDDVEPVDHFALEARGCRERGITDRRPDIGEEAEVLAQPQEACLWAGVVVDLVPFRPSDRPEDHGIRGMRLCHGLLPDGDLMGVITAAAYQLFLSLEPHVPARVEPCNELFHFGHHFGADAVAGEKEKLVCRHGPGNRSQCRKIHTITNYREREGRLHYLLFLKKLITS